MCTQGDHRGLPRRYPYTCPRTTTFLRVQKFVFSQERDVHQSRVRRVEDRPIFAPTCFAEKSKNDAYNDEHQRHANEYSDHRWIHILEAGRFFVLGDANYDTVGLRHRNLLEDANASAIPAFRLAHPRLALFVKEAGLVDVCRLSTFVNMIRDCKLFFAGAYALLRLAVRSVETAITVTLATVAKLFVTSVGEIFDSGRFRWIRQAEGRPVEGDQETGDDGANQVHI